jgi:hypothetical protein
MLLLRSHGRGLIGRRAATCAPTPIRLAYVDSVDHIVCSGALSAIFCTTGFRRRFVSTTVSVLAVALRQLGEIQGAVRKSWLKL